MARPIDFIRHEIANISERIGKLKQECLRTEPISPRHVRWSEYWSLKRSASVWLCALQIEKFYDGMVPTRSELERDLALPTSDVLRANSKERGTKDVFGGLTCMTRARRQLAKYPSMHDDLDAWVQKRENERQARLAAADA